MAKELHQGVARCVLLLCQLLQVLALCPPPFDMEAGVCIYVNTAQNYSWCSANQQCASIGGELINSYSSLKLLGNMSSLNCSCNLFFGISDLPDEQNKNKTGWQAINGKGVAPIDDAMWHTRDPNNAGGTQDCIGQHKDTARRLVDLHCSDPHGFVCEYSVLPTNAAAVLQWTRTEFKKTSYNANTEYCYADWPEVHSEMACVFAAVSAGNSRHVLYNSKLRTCRLLLFTDAQVEQEIETSADWVKFSVN